MFNQLRLSASNDSPCLGKVRFNSFLIVGQARMTKLKLMSHFNVLQINKSMTAFFYMACQTSHIFNRKLLEIQGQPNDYLLDTVNSQFVKNIIYCH